jgi:hypothetical protein
VALDIGGFQGESAVYFWILMPRKKIIYELVQEYCDQISVNKRLNNIDSEIFQCDIGIEDSPLLIDVFASGQAKRKRVEVKNITKVLPDSNADIGKVDCEGTEIYLTSVPNKILRKMLLYMLELQG